MGLMQDTLRSIELQAEQATEAEQATKAALCAADKMHAVEDLAAEIRDGHDEPVALASATTSECDVWLQCSTQESAERLAKWCAVNRAALILKRITRIGSYYYDLRRVGAEPVKVVCLFKGIQLGDLDYMREEVAA